jgi:hypothetical protein
MCGAKALYKSETAILLIFFNRPDLARISLNKLVESKRNIYISIDGPRNSSDKPNVQECIALAESFAEHYSRISAVKLLIRESNLGCKIAVRSAINWAFETEEKLIILEDDISFKDEFLETMDNWLEKFDASKEVFHLNGYNPLPKNMEVNFSYLCRNAHVWGWATWRDRWSFYDGELETWDGSDLRLLPGLLGQDLSDDFCDYWNRQLIACSEGLDTWDIQWVYSQWRYGGFALTPGSRLTGNIGFDERATHTKQSGGRSRERQPKSHRGKFLNPTDPTLNLELSTEHDLIEHGIKGRQNFLSSPIWTLKTSLVRGYLSLLRIKFFHQLIASLFASLLALKSRSGTLKGVFRKTSFLKSKRVSIMTQKAKIYFLGVVKFGFRAYKFLSWRIFRK